MKTLKLLLPIFLLLISLSPSFAKKDKKIADVTYICSIDCDHCKKTILKNIPYEKGVKNVEVSIPTKEVKVTFRTDKTDIKKLELAIEKLGYEADVKKQEKETKTKDCCSHKK
ncbi:heavy-metal-associated domain-containing protein [Halosquirtibacter laminarini]|uniref:Heavy-metal-associated domain-containing protein n=1 Tax=Halosquirtibacter laminarini TaxID=3374600 RepID=A0AC61NJU5_9BACT|nr:heavy-metal-associated domain-containing protein [Prolixibacteraceae bacterium]